MEIDPFIDMAMRSGLHELRIIHGMGTGALRAGLHKYFKTDKRIKEFRLGRYGEGESGVTILTLKMIKDENYFDNCATTKTDPAYIGLTSRFLTEEYFNPSSLSKCSTNVFSGSKKLVRLFFQHWAEKTEILSLRRPAPKPTIPRFSALLSEEGETSFLPLRNILRFIIR